VVGPVEDEFKAALLKKFENVNIYSPCPPPMDVNGTCLFLLSGVMVVRSHLPSSSPADSFADPMSPYRPF
jgi:hypothetical protein